MENWGLMGLVEVGASPFFLLLAGDLLSLRCSIEWGGPQKKLKPLREIRVANLDDEPFPHWPLINQVAQKIRYHEVSPHNPLPITDLEGSIAFDAGGETIHILCGGISTDSMCGVGVKHGNFHPVIWDVEENGIVDSLGLVHGDVVDLIR